MTLCLAPSTAAFTIWKTMVVLHLSLAATKAAVVKIPSPATSNASATSSMPLARSVSLVPRENSKIVLICWCSMDQRTPVVPIATVVGGVMRLVF
jgi:hypothetical protein